jgi:hypothetical protein
VIIIVAALLLLGGCVVFMSIRFGGQVQYNPLTRRVFRIDSEDVKSVRLQSGNTGAVIEYTDREDIEEMIGHLNSFRYKRRVPIPEDSSGWTYGIRLYYLDGEAHFYLISGDDAIRVGNSWFFGSGDYFEEWRTVIKQLPPPSDE